MKKILIIAICNIILLININAQNVGIGTTTPQSQLHIGSNSTNELIIGRDKNTGGYTSLLLGTSAVSNGYGYIQTVQSAGSTWGNLILNPIGGNVGIGTAAPHSSAIIDIFSENKGVLFPRMTTAQRNGIVNPAQGIHVFNTTIGTLEYYDAVSNTWKAYCSNCGSGQGAWSTNASGMLYNTSLGPVSIGANYINSNNYKFLVDGKTYITNDNNNNVSDPLLTLVKDGIGVSQSDDGFNVKIGFYTTATSAYVQTHTNTNLNFATNNQNASMVLTTAGNLVLGSANATTERLNVGGNAAISGNLTVSNGDGIVRNSNATQLRTLLYQSPANLNFGLNPGQSASFPISFSAFASVPVISLGQTTGITNSDNLLMTVEAVTTSTATINFRNAGTQVVAGSNAVLRAIIIGAQ